MKTKVPGSGQRREVEAGEGEELWKFNLGERSTLCHQRRPSPTRTRKNTLVPSITPSNTSSVPTRPRPSSQLCVQLPCVCRMQGEKSWPVSDWLVPQYTVKRNMILPVNVAYRSNLNWTSFSRGQFNKFPANATENHK